MSALVGAGVVLLAGVLSAQQIANRFVSVRVLEVPTLEIAPHPRDAIRVVEGVPFTVPAGRILMMTGLIQVTGSDTVVSASINGVKVLRAMNHESVGGVVEIPFGLTAGAGDVVDVVSSSVLSSGLLGYLVDA